jgi:hypothetical protein
MVNVAAVVTYVTILRFRQSNSSREGRRFVYESKRKADKNVTGYGCGGEQEIDEQQH